MSQGNNNTNTYQWSDIANATGNVGWEYEYTRTREGVQSMDVYDESGNFVVTVPNSSHPSNSDGIPGPGPLEVKRVMVYDIFQKGQNQNLQSAIETLAYLGGELISERR